MAGGFLARQLTRELPELRVALFEKSHERGFRAGESTVEIASHYMIRKLGLSSYLYEEHLPKNGLRFFFDTPGRDTALHQMTEIGSESLPFHPAFQVDRSRLDADLLRMAADAGVDVQIGSRIGAVELGRDGSTHRVRVLEPGGQRSEYEARWVLDASGRSRVLAKQLDLTVPEPSHQVTAIWGRFEGGADIDSLGPEAFRERVRYTSRHLSTLHFLYPGYWVWVIPLRGGLSSVGVVGDPSVLDEISDAAGLLSFLRSHAGLRELHESSKPVDFLRYRNLPYGTRQYFSRDRWGLTGESASFADPLYSPGGDFIALANDFLVDLIRRDFAGDDAAELTERTQLYDGFMRLRHETAMRLYRGLYSTLGSSDLTRLKWNLDIALYYNLWLSPFMTDQHLDMRFVKRQLSHQPYILQAMENFAALFRTAEAELHASKRYFAGNVGQYGDGRECLDFMMDVGKARTMKEMLIQTNATFNRVRNDALDLIEGPENREAKPLSFFMSPKDLALST